MANGEIYHVYNKSIGGIEIFTDTKVLKRVLELLDYYAFDPDLSFSKYKKLNKKQRSDYIGIIKSHKPFVHVYSFSLMPNHLHLLLKQNKDRGISIFLSNFQNAFAKYFNKLADREGGVFMRPFKAKRIEDDDVFVHVSRYIHLNPVTSYLIEPGELVKYPWTSFSYYAQGKNLDFLNKKELLNIFGSFNKYKKFVLDQADYQRTLKYIKDLSLE